MSDLFTQQSDGSIAVPITSKKHREIVQRFIGAADVLTDMLSKMPGWQAAKTVVEATVSDLKIAMYGHNVRAAAKAGVDLTAYRVTSIDGTSVVCHPVPDESAEG